MKTQDTQHICHAELVSASFNKDCRRSNPANKGLLKGWIATLTTFARNDRKRVAFTLAEVPEARQYGSKQAAFTLAEVLITLGIIGVVAAMTIPTLMQKYQSLVLDVQFKRAYSTLLNAHKMVQGSFGYIPRCYYGDTNAGIPKDFTDCEEYTNLLLQQLKLMKACSSNAMRTGCIPKYKSGEEVAKEKNPDISDDDAELLRYKPAGGCTSLSRNSLDSYPAYHLSNGMILFSAHSNAARLATNTVIDINGAQGPNKWGYDVFYVYLYFDGKKFYHRGNGCQPIESGGVSMDTKLKQMGFAQR